MASALWYCNAALGQWGTTANRRVDWDSDDIEVSLHTQTYNPSQDNDIFMTHATNEISGGGYVRQNLVTTAPTLDTATNTVILGAADTTFASLTNTFRYAVISKNNGTAATSPLLGYVDLTNRSTSGTNFVINWSDTGGVLQVVAS